MNDFFLNLIHSHHLINHGRTALRWLLIVTIIWVSFLSVSAQAPSASTSAYSCSGQLPTKDSRYNGRVIQQQLKVIYQPDAAYQAALKSNGRLLTDGIFGPVTRQWLINFCNDFNVSDTVSETSGSSLDFVDTTLKDLSRAAEISAVFPNWRDSVESGELLTLSSSQLAELLAPDLIPGSTGSSSSGSQANIPSYYYQLTDNDLNRQATLTALTALGKQQFSQRNELYNQLVTLIDQLDVTFNPALDLNSFIQSQSIDQATQSNSETESTTTSQTSKNSDATEPASSSGTTTDSGSSSSSSSSTSSTPSSASSSSSNSDSTASSASDSSTSSTTSTTTSDGESNSDTSQQTADDGKSVTESSTTATTKTTAPLITWQLDSDALATALQKQNIYVVAASLQKLLEPIANQVFASEYLMQAAMTLEGIDTSSSDAENVLKVAYKSGLAPDTSTPVVWEAPAGCGCQDSRDSIFNDATFYGFFPYWYQSEEQQVINFSQLDRIGFFGAVAKPSNSGSLLVLPPNWKPEPDNTQFIRLAHRYRSEVDLVVTTPRDLTLVSLIELLDKPLIDQLVDAIDQPLDSTFINRMKPIMTLGIEPIPSIGDGITLDIDLSVLKTSQSQQIFITFVRELKFALLKQEGSDIASNSDVVASPHDRYFLNVVIPANQVLSEDSSSFYQFDNLNALGQVTNLMIIRPQVDTADTTGTSGQSDSSQEAIAQQELTQIQEFHHWLSNQSDQLAVEKLFKQIVPMLITEFNRNSEIELTQLLRLSSWSFIGAAYQPIPLNDLSQQLVDDTFYPKTSSLPSMFAALQEQILVVMDWICPNRWLLRTILFVVFIGIAAVLIISNWYYELRKYLVQLPFVLLCIGSLAALMLVFVADPYFKAYQVPILLGFMALIIWILLVVRWLTMEGDKP
ncbi:hypothetical protein OFO16_06980 [Vibrio natriegens]|uniref:hypothetical protein n=1 Tax=Vibrio natriegens TaxID=691 RepID=UPI0021E8CB72|nr:hypothetical protein [Vibrio natriegens]UYI48396.1 hypothetical protein OFO16_06980 [Vibrio natriegens]